MLPFELIIVLDALIGLVYFDDRQIQVRSINLEAGVQGLAVGRDLLERLEDSEAIEEQPGWRLELNLLPTEPEKEGPLPASTNLENVRQLLVRAHTSESDFSLMSACTALEHAFVIAAERADLELPSSPVAALKTLYAYGLIGYDDYNKVDAAFELRDEIAHGRSADVDAEPWLASIEPIVHDLLTGAPD